MEVEKTVQETTHAYPDVDFICPFFEKACPARIAFQSFTVHQKGTRKGAQ
jgi:hypothetical protein